MGSLTLLGRRRWIASVKDCTGYEHNVIADDALTAAMLLADMLAEQVGKDDE